MPNIFVWPDSPPIVRKCLVYKADVSTIDPLVEDPGPLVIPLLFNIEGTDSNFFASLFSELAPDLRATYGPSTRDHITMRINHYGRDPQHPHLENYCSIFWTKDIEHPKNGTLCRMLGVDPDIPSARPMWRGDVVVAFAQQDQRIVDENKTVTDQRRVKPFFSWKDVPSEAPFVMAKYFREEYDSAEWLESYQVDLEWAHATLEEQRFIMSPLNRLIVRLLPWDWLRSEPFKCSEHSLEIAKVHMRWAEEESERAERFERRACISCGEKRPVKVCPCKRAHYCSVACQKQDWKSGHKALLAHRKGCKLKGSADDSGYYEVD